MDIKILKKVSRKLKHCEAILYQTRKIRTMKDPSKSLFIGNGGLMCGLQRDYLVCLFKEYGNLESLVMLPGEPYSFVTFHNLEDAATALKCINGQKQSSGHTFYLSYIATADVPPNTEREMSLPPGLVLLENLLTEREEEELLASVTSEDVDEKALLKHRKVRHFGYEFLYKSNNVDKDKPLDEKIPDVCRPHLERLVALGHLSQVPDQLTVNCYLPGQGIPPHIDTHSAFEDGIVSISLGSQVVMDFYHPDGATVPVLLPRRSILIMSGESRYLWKHGITPRKTDVVPSKEGGSNVTLSERSTRTSLTFRTIRRSDSCKCEYKDQCDSQKTMLPIVDFLNNNKAEELEKKYVNQVYEEIADHFSTTRYKPWPKVVEFLRSVPQGSVVLDVGCGNGKNMKLTAGCFEVACDASLNLARLCSKRQTEVLVADCLRLPFRDSAVDAVICIAVIHHMSTKERRAKAVQEILRVLRPRGKALIYVWAFEQVGPAGPSKYLQTKQPFEQQDVFVPWKKNTSQQQTHQRYYHVFTNGELEELVSECGATILTSYYDEGNWCVSLVSH